MRSVRASLPVRPVVSSRARATPQRAAASALQTNKLQHVNKVAQLSRSKQSAKIVSRSGLARSSTSLRSASQAKAKQSSLFSSLLSSQQASSKQLMKQAMPKMTIKSYFNDLWNNKLAGGSLLAASTIVGGSTIPTVTGGAALAGAAFVVYALQRYRRCPPNSILVIHGRTGKTGARCIHGGGAFVWPIVQDYSYMSLEPIQIVANLKDALSKENIRVNVPTVFTVAIGSEPQLMQNAAVRLLNSTRDQICGEASHIIYGQLRQTIASMSIEDITRDRQNFKNLISSHVEEDLAKLGLEVINVNITDITDDSGYIEALGRKAAQEVIQKALIDVAEQHRIGSTGVAENKKNEALAIAQLNMEREIGENQARTSKDARVSEQHRQMRVQIAGANANALLGENQAKAIEVTSAAELKVKQSEAFQLSETAKNSAELAVAESLARASTKVALAQAERIEAEKRAELEAPAKALKAQIVIQAEADAEVLKIRALAEAEAAFRRKEAEAKGEFEILQKKALGYKHLVESCGGAQQAFQLSMLDHMDTLSQNAAQAISNIKFDKITVWDSNPNGQQSATANFVKSMVTALPPALDLVKNFGGMEPILGKFGLQDNPATPSSSPSDYQVHGNDASDAQIRRETDSKFQELIKGRTQQ